MGGCMYWLYFARDFYRAGHGASALAAAMPVSEGVAACACSIAQRAEYQPKRQPEFVVRSAEICVSRLLTGWKVKLQQHPHRLPAYLQRLSVDGEHAFGVWDEEAGFSLFSANFDRITGLSSGECAGHEWIHQIHHTQQYAVNEALLGALEGRDGQCLVQAARLQDGAETRWLLMDVKAARGRGRISWCCFAI
jgi:PAS domain-containing protein